MSRKAQASLEFISTYGWTFLTIILVSGVLVYVGINQIQSNKPLKCVITSDFRCVESAVFEADQIYFELVLENKLGVDIEIDKIYLSDSQKRTTLDCASFTSVKSSKQISVSCPQGNIPYTKDDYYDLDIIIEYHRKEGSYVFNTTGEVSFKA